MRCRALLLITFLSANCWAHTLRAKRSVKPDPAYSAALQAADRFLHAWQTQDHEAGIMMLSDGARQRISPEQLEEFFSPAANAAFEIQHGKLHKAGEYVFPVVLFGLAESSGHVRFGQIVIVKAGKNDWAVERLP